MWIVLTSCACMPNSCWGKYRNVALVKLNQEYTARDYRPRMISTRARGVLKVQHLGHHFVGETTRCAYDREVARAEGIAYELNNADPMVENDMLFTLGGSA